MKIKQTLLNNIIIQQKVIIEENLLLFCLCNCGKRVTQLKNLYINGHNRKGFKLLDDIKLKMSKSAIGRKNTIEQNRKISKFNIRRKHSKETRLKESNSHKGKIHSDKWNKNISKVLKGRSISYEWKQKISKSHIGKKRSKFHCLNISKARIGKKQTIETKQKSSISRKKYIAENGLENAHEGKNERYILDKIEKSLNKKIYRNHWLISILIEGKSCDGFLYEYNLPIEILEKHHFKSNGELSNKDLDRQVYIANELHCMIYYIPEQEFLKNPDKEIQRLKNFLLLLDEERNKI